MKIHQKVDVVTMGAGWTSAILGWKLGEAGYSVVALEQGGNRQTYPDFAHNHDGLRYHNRYAMMHPLTREAWTWRPHPRAPALPMRRYGSFHPGQGVGGAAVHWSGQLWRFYPSDFQYRTHHIERYGEEMLPEGNRIQDWPITYDELEPYYDAFEWDLGASGVAGNLQGEIQDEGNPFEGPRSRPYPLPPVALNVPSRMFAEAGRDLGYAPFPQPSGILSEGYVDATGVPRSGCINCGFCTRYGCEVDAKGSSITTHLPLALRTGNYHIRTHSVVTGIEMGRDGAAVGLRFVDAEGNEHLQPAEVVVLSGYPLSNVRMLLLSRSQTHPDGVGNNQGMVGRNYTYQMWKTPAFGVFEGRRFNLFMGSGSNQNAIQDINADNFDHSGLDFIGGAGLTCTTGEREPISAIEGIPLEDDEPDWGADWKRYALGNWDSYFGIVIQGESLPYEDQYLDLDPHYADAYGLPLLRITYDFHENDYRLYRYVAARVVEIMERMEPDRISVTEELDPYNIHEYQSTHNNGGAIMGSSPADSVTNKYGQVWDAPNVFVTGAALYPQNPGFNPSDTLCALAYMTGDTLAQRYFRAPGELLL